MVYFSKYALQLYANTAPGHASIYTGTTPSVHGIVSNEWFSRKLGKEMYCTDDADVITIGDGTKEEEKCLLKICYLLR
jgi:predicted AlkP superfamily pyrophosphatase or phosphodiesterase